MGCDVYANCNEIACKAGANKVIADMPDVCLSPPPPPAGPVPVPYPDTSFSKDMQNGSKTVLIKDKEVMLKDQSFYKTSPLGDEAATNSFGANVVSHVITGKTYCVAWSMDVKFEDQNVDRHLDLTTSNNASPMSSTGPLLTAAEMNKPKNAAGLGKKKSDPTICNNNHTWVCNKYSCADCWPPPGCPANAAQEDKEYKEKQAGSQEDRVKNKHDEDKAKDEKMKARQRAQGKPEVGDPGAVFESAALDKAVNAKPPETIEHITYWAHCSACHWQQEVDLVTDKKVKEVKKSAGGFKTSQTSRISQIRDACFKDKDLELVTEGQTNVDEMKAKIKEKEWQAAVGPKGADVKDP